MLLSRAGQHVALACYGILARTKLTSVPLVRRVFLFMYRIYKRRFEAGPVDQLRRFVPPGTAVIDIGANVGFFTEKFAEWVGPAGIVLAVEPDEENLASLARAIARFGERPSIELVAAVASDRVGRLPLTLDPLHPGNHRIAVNGKGVEVAAVTVDNLVCERGLRVALVKIDVQGAELKVLHGARNTLRSQAPVLFVEVDDAALHRYGASAVELAEFLTTEGYSLHCLDSDGSLKTVDSIGSTPGDRGYIDLLCIPAQIRPAAPQPGRQ